MASKEKSTSERTHMRVKVQQDGESVVHTEGVVLLPITSGAIPSWPSCGLPV